jgi:hypothetical protein
MPVLQRPIVPSLSAQPSDISHTIKTPLQGLITLYANNDCTSPLTQPTVPVLLGECYNLPATGIRSVSIDSSSLPACDDDSSPLLIVSNLADCKPSTAEISAADGDGAADSCQAFSSGVDGGSVGSVRIACFGGGFITVAKREVASSTEVEVESQSRGWKARDTDVNVDVNATCPCNSCVVM